MGHPPAEAASQTQQHAAATHRPKSVPGHAWTGQLPGSLPSRLAALRCRCWVTGCAHFFLSSLMSMVQAAFSLCWAGGLPPPPPPGLPPYPRPGGPPLPMSLPPGLPPLCRRLLPHACQGSIPEQPVILLVAVRHADARSQMPRDMLGSQADGSRGVALDLDHGCHSLALSEADAFANAICSPCRTSAALVALLHGGPSNSVTAC